MRIYQLNPHPIIKRQRQREAARYAIELERIRQIKGAIAQLAKPCKASLPLRFFVVGDTICLICDSFAAADRYLTTGTPLLNPDTLPPIAGEWHLLTLYGEGQELKVWGYPLPIGRETSAWHGQPVNPCPILEGESEKAIAQEVTRLLSLARIDGDVPVKVEGTTLCVTAPCQFDAEYLLATAAQFDTDDLDGWQVQSCFVEAGQAISCGVPVAIGRGGAGNWWDLPPWHFT